MPELKKNEIKRLTKKAIATSFKSNGCTSATKSAGAVDYLSIGLKGTHQKCAAIYGARGMGASIWIKAGAFAKCKDILKKSSTKVEDISFFRRGFQWAVYIKDFDDPNIEVVVNACIEHGAERWAHYQDKATEEKLRKKNMAKREKAMSKRRKDPWA
tara:strand:- start:86 stop:556 length:471 start_codon:yes stop_codon:yes gene_type:complete